MYHFIDHFILIIFFQYQLTFANELVLLSLFKQYKTKIMKASNTIKEHVNLIIDIICIVLFF